MDSKTKTLIGVTIAIIAVLFIGKYVIDKTNQSGEKKDISIKKSETLEERLSRSSYNRNSNSKELNMNESMDYVKSVLTDDIVEVGTYYDSKNGVTEKTYESNGKEILVKFYHPLREGSGELDEYNLGRTIGIEFEILNTNENKK